MNAAEKTVRKILKGFPGVVIFFFSLISLYLPYEAEICPYILKYLPYSRYIAGGLLIIAFFTLYCSRLRLFRDNWYLLAVCIFIIILIYSTYINDADLKSALGSKGVTAIFAIMNMAIFLRVAPKRTLLIAFFWYLAINIANTYCIFRFWGVGLWEVWGVSRNELISIVGNYNGGVEFVLPMALCGSAYAHRYGKWMDYLNYAAMLMSLAMAFKCDSWTQIIVYALAIGFMIVGNIAMIAKGAAHVIRLIFNPILMVGANAAVYIVVIWMGNAEWVTKFGIDQSFHGRRHIWDMAISYIYEKPIWGNGLETVNRVASKITGYAHSHSFFLHMTYVTGIIGTAAIIALLAVTVIVWFRVKNDRVAYMMSFMTFLLCLTNLFEMYTIPFFLYTLGMIYYIGKTSDEHNANTRQNTKHR